MRDDVSDADAIQNRYLERLSASGVPAEPA
jgi:hypothetical protein